MNLKLIGMNKKHERSRRLTQKQLRTARKLVKVLVKNFPLFTEVTTELTEHHG